MLWESPCQVLTDVLVHKYFASCTTEQTAESKPQAGRGQDTTEETPSRFPTARSTRSASARIKSGESFSAGIMWNSAIPRDSACSRASILISCSVSICSVKNEIGITRSRLTPLCANLSMVSSSEGGSHFCGPTLLWNPKLWGLSQDPSCITSWTVSCICIG